MQSLSLLRAIQLGVVSARTDTSGFFYEFANGNPWHTGTVMSPGCTNVEYNYNGEAIWASDPNWNWRAPAAGSATLSDTWR